jgi:hypothetical protein
LIISRGKLLEPYKRESNAKVKERLLLAIRLVDDGQLPAHVAKELLMSKLLADKEGIKGLRNRPTSRRIPQIPLEVSARI